MSTSTATPPPASASLRPPSIMRFTTHLDSESFRRFSPSRTSIASSWRPIRSCRTRWASLHIYLPSSGDGQVPLSAIAKVKERNGPLEIDHIGQLPAAMISFEFRARLRLAPPSPRFERGTAGRIAAEITTHFRALRPPFNPRYRAASHYRRHHHRIYRARRSV